MDSRLFTLTSRGPLQIASGPRGLLHALAWCAAVQSLAPFTPAAAVTGAQSAPPASVPSSAPSGEPSSAAKGRRPFQPGVEIDWSAPAVYAQAHVVLREGPLEFFACFTGKEHESILRFDGRAEHLYVALGLIGIEPGHPPRWNEDERRYEPPQGDLVDVSVIAAGPDDADEAPAFSWLRELEYGRVPPSRPWVFSGSQRTQGGGLAADVTGAGIGLVDFSDSLLSLTRSHTSRNADLWVEARTERIPAEGTAVWVVFRPARARTHRMELDALGALWVDGRYASLPDAVDLIEITRRLRPEYVQRIRVHKALRADVQRVRHVLLALGLSRESFTLGE